MLKKIMVLFFVSFSIIFSVNAKERDIIFIENTTLKELSVYEETKELLKNSVAALSIQRTNGGEFGFFKSLVNEKPAELKEEDAPIYMNDIEENNVSIKGYVEKDGTLYVPSKFLLSGQPSRDRFYIYHTNSIRELIDLLRQIKDKKNKDILIISWKRYSEKRYERYLLPLIYYDGDKRGIFYSETTKNIGILDYKNINNIIKGNFKDLRIVNGDLNDIYAKRILLLSEKRDFLKLFSYYICVTTLLNVLFLKLNKPQWISYLSLSIVMLPIMVLIEPLFSLDNFIFKVVLIAVGTLLIGLCSEKRSIYIPITFFLIIIYVDALTTNYLLKNSLLSYEPSLGARFYGIGNEYLGIIISYNLIITNRLKFKIQWVVWFLNGLLLLSSRCGSNFGGFLTCLGITIITAPPVIILALLFFAAIIILKSDNHINTFFKNALSGNREYILAIFKNKLYTQRRLITFNRWTVITALATAAYIYEVLKGKLNFSGNKFIFVLCCILITFLNDSGIVSLALFLTLYVNYLFFINGIEKIND